METERFPQQVFTLELNIGTLRDKCCEFCNGDSDLSRVSSGNP